MHVDMNLQMQYWLAAALCALLGLSTRIAYMRGVFWCRQGRKQQLKFMEHGQPM